MLKSRRPTFPFFFSPLGLKSLGDYLAWDFEDFLDFWLLIFAFPLYTLGVFLCGTFQLVSDSLRLRGHRKVAILAHPLKLSARWRCCSLEQIYGTRA